MDYAYENDFDISSENAFRWHYLQIYDSSFELRFLCVCEHCNSFICIDHIFYHFNLQFKN